jgi:hypothetical protein
MPVAAGGVDDEDVAAVVGGFALGFFGEAEDERRCRAGLRLWFAFVELRASDGLGDDFELLAGGGAVDVDRDEHGAVAALFEPLRRACRRWWSCRSPAGRP